MARTLDRPTIDRYVSERTNNLSLTAEELELIGDSLSRFLTFSIRLFQRNVGGEVTDDQIILMVDNFMSGVFNLYNAAKVASQ